MFVQAAVDAAHAEAATLCPFFGNAGLEDPVAAPFRQNRCPPVFFLERVVVLYEHEHVLRALKRQGAHRPQIRLPQVSKTDEPIVDRQEARAQQWAGGTWLGSVRLPQRHPLRGPTGASVALLRQERLTYRQRTGGDARERAISASDGQRRASGHNT